MALDQKFFKKSTAATGLADQDQGLTVHLDTNDVDSYDGDGTIWYDIAGHEVNIPLTDNNDNLEIHIDASNSNSYAGTGSTITDISTNGYSFSTHGNATFGSDLRGYFTLDGSDDDLRTTNAVTGFSGDVTFEWWFNASESNNFALLHANPASNDSGINGIFIGNAAGSAGTIEIYRKTTGGTLHSGQSSSTGLSGMASDGWVHFVITITSANVCKFYKDGTYQGTLTLNGNGTNHDTYNFVSIGGYNNTSYEFAGKMGCFRMYSEILTASDIGQNYRAGNNFSYSSIITSKHEVTQGTLYSTNLALSLDANGYTSGTWSNTANSSYNATVNGAAHYNDGDSDYFNFDGSDDYAEVGAYTGADIGSGGFTLEAWCLCEASSGADTIASNLGPSDTTGYQLYIDAGTGVKLYIYSDSSNYRQLTTTSAITQSTWNHCVFTVASASNGAAIKLYVNGIEKDSDTLNSNYTGAAHGLDIGRYPYNNTKYFDGKIAQVRTYSAALTSAQVTTNYNATKALYQNPTMEMNLLGSAYTSGATWSDSSGKGNNGSISGTPSYDQELGDYLNFSPGQTSGAGTSSTTRLTVSSFDSLQTATAFTIELWFKSSTASSDGMIWNVYDSSSSARKFSLSWNNNNFRWVVYSASGGYNASQDLFSTNTFSTNTWLHVVATYNYNTEMKIYVDGVLEGAESNPNLGVNTTTTTQMRIGDRSDGYAVDTQVGQARFYTSALTQAQAVQNYLATKDKYPNGSNATIGGSPTWSTNSSPAYNYWGLDANSEYFNIPDNSFFDLVSNQSMELWIYRTGTGAQHFINKATNSASNYGWQMFWQSGNYYFQMHNAPYSAVSQNVVANTTVNTWLHIVLTAGESKEWKLYIDATLGSTATVSGTVAPTTADLHIGRYSLTSTYGLGGRLGMVKFYNKTLSADEVTAARNNTKENFGL